MYRYCNTSGLMTLSMENATGKPCGQKPQFDATHFFYSKIHGFMKSFY